MTMWVLKTAEGAEPALTFRLVPGNIKTIGRATGADFIVDATMVSRVHCRLTAGSGEIELEDLDGHRVDGRARVKAGDRIGVGRVELEICDS
jgi:pSer/pThr/pTyr-binding forkhead associated (FHA) protein